MIRPEILLMILVMALTVYLVRTIPLVVFRRKIKSRFLQSFFHYIPYTVIAAMTLPAIFTSAGGWIPSLAGFVVGCVLAYFRKPMIIVALATCAASLAVTFLT